MDITLADVNVVVDLFHAAAPRLSDNDTCERIWPQLSGGQNMPQHHIHLKYTQFYRSNVVALWQYLDPGNRRRLYSWLCQNFSNVPQSAVLYHCAELLNVIDYHMGFRQFAQVWTQPEDADAKFCTYKDSCESNAVLFFKSLCQQDQQRLLDWCLKNYKSLLQLSPF